MTPAIKQCQQHKIAFQLHQYQHQANASSYGLEAAEKLGIDSSLVFKTLVVELDGSNLAVAIVPVDKQLNFKCLAKALKVKKAKMAQAKHVQASTGYVLGGVSPLGQKKQLPTVIDESSLQFDTIYISGGKRGLEIELTANDLAKLIKGTFAKLT